MSLQKVNAPIFEPHKHHTSLAHARTQAASMGLLDKLWTDASAGPRPESGLGRLRKYSSFTFRPSLSAASAKDEAAGSGVADGGRRPYGEDLSPEAPRVTRSIMIKKPPGWVSPEIGSPLSSPAGSAPPLSPFSGGGGGGGKEWNRFRRKSMSDAQAGRSEERAAEVAATSSFPPFEV